MVRRLSKCRAAFIAFLQSLVLHVWLWSGVVILIANCLFIRKLWDGLDEYCMLMQLASDQPFAASPPGSVADMLRCE